MCYTNILLYVIITLLCVMITCVIITLLCVVITLLCVIISVCHCYYSGKSKSMSGIDLERIGEYCDYKVKDWREDLFLLFLSSSSFGYKNNNTDNRERSLHQNV